MRQISFVATVLCLSSNVLSTAAFAPQANVSKKASCSKTITIFSANDDDDDDDPQQSNEYNGDGSEGMQDNGGNSEDQKQNLDRSTADMSTRNPPLLGEVAIDGSLVVLAPAVVIGVVGLISGVYIAFNSGDEFVQTATQSDNNSIAVQATIQQANSDSCRGICTQDQDGLENFMNSLHK
ncbi:MAG: hypothetical protein SGBAC_006891 [Bacillariaceae sp.]